MKKSSLEKPNPEPLVLTPGPVRISAKLKKILHQDLPYNRTADFSVLTLGIIQNLKSVVQSEGDVVLFTASGTGAMEAAVLNFLHHKDHVLVLNGGTFGQRWLDLCHFHKISCEEYKIEAGSQPDLSELEKFFRTGRFTAFLINAHETSTGVLYPLEEIGKLTKQYGIFHVVDAIGSICCDPYFMDAWHIDVTILSSQKGLALPPGLSFLAFNTQAKERALNKHIQSYYFHVPTYLKNQQRGQMPYTPAIGLYLLLSERLKEIKSHGMYFEVQKHEARAMHFRQAIKDMPLKNFPEKPSNAMTALKCKAKTDAKRLVESLERNYQIYLAPNGGVLEKEVFRISHMGEQDPQDITRVVNALEDLLKE